MTPYTNTNPCPRCGGLDYTYFAGDGPAKPGDLHYIHLCTTSTCKKCLYQEKFWNHETGFARQETPEQNTDLLLLMSLKLLPSGMPGNEDTWCALRDWILKNKARAMEWRNNPPSAAEEIEIYKEFGRFPINPNSIKQVEQNIGITSWGTDYDDKNPEIQEVIDWFESQKNAGATHIEFRHAYDEVSAEAYKMRPETYEETVARQKRKYEEKKRQEIREKTTLAELKAKYEKDY